jgi:prepilin-type N-terminal cleavage/methylation domain-containing protein
MMFPKSWRSAFTLIELLVVIAVAAILVSLLMPTLGMSKDLARESACKTNQRSLYLAVRTYSAEHRSTLPYAASLEFHMQGQFGFYGDFSPQRPLVGVYNDGLHLLPVKLKGYMDVFSPGWFCPGWPIDKPYFPAGGGWFIRGHPPSPFAPVGPWFGGGPTVADARYAIAPANIGAGYEYEPFTPVSGLHWMVTEDQHVAEYKARKLAFGSFVNFDRGYAPEKARITSCLMVQYSATGNPNLVDPRDTGRVGPHQRGTRWDVLRADGSVGTTTGWFASGARDVVLRNWEQSHWFPPDWTWK